MQRQTPARALRLAIASVIALAGCSTGNDVTGTTETPTAPVFTTQPSSLLATVGTTGLLIAIPSGTTPIGLQWYHDSVAVTGATRDTLPVGPITAADAGVYYAIATNLAGSDTTTAATITIVPVVSSTAWRQSGGAGASTGREYGSAVADESAIYVFNGGVYTFNAPNVTKSGATSDAVASRARGQNAAVRAGSNGHIYMVEPVIATDSAGATAFFATGAGSKVQVSGGIIGTSAATAPAIGVSDGGTVVVNGGTLTATSADGIVAWAQTAADAPAAVTLGAGTTLTAGTGVLARAAGGATLTLTLDSVTVAGAAVADATSALALVLQHQASWGGTMQGGAVSLDATGTWNVTGASAVTALTGAAISGTAVTNIIGTATVTYDATLPANAALGGKTYTLAGGGQLKPK
ncbi:MAG TPA: hypothetical protein VG916_13105 [Gemmatimonadaceae bacterium]|nr:hypothetical protein [Gemmatimonadaceae bacterium]